MNQKGFVNIIIIIGVVVFAGVAGYFIFTKEAAKIKVFANKEQCEKEAGSNCIYYLCDIPIGDLYQKLCIKGLGSGWYSSKEIGDSETAQSETAQWKIYTNTEYKYRVNYPPDWELGQITVKQSTWAGNVLQGEEIHKVTFLEKEYRLWQADFAVRILPNSENLSIKQWREAQLQKSDAEQAECRKENPESPCLSARDLQRGEEQITFNGLTAYKISIFGFDHTRECVQVTKDKFVYDLCYDGANPNDPDFDKHRGITTDILGSFKFLN